MNNLFQPAHIYDYHPDRMFPAEESAAIAVREYDARAITRRYDPASDRAYSDMFTCAALVWC